MSLLVSGRIASLILLIISTILVFFYIDRSRKGKAPEMRRIVALDALKEGVARATEAGRPVHWTTGAGTPGAYAIMYSSGASATVAALSILSEVARIVTEYDANLIASCPWVDMLPLVEDTIKTQYEAAGKPELFKADTIRYAPSGFPFVASTLNTIGYDVHGGTNIFVGPFWHEALVWGEASRQHGCFAIGGTGPGLGQIPFMVATMDYVFIGEELFAADTYITKDPAKIGSIVATDIIKNALLVFTALAAIALTFGSSALLSLLKM